MGHPFFLVDGFFSPTVSISELLFGNVKRHLILNSWEMAWEIGWVFHADKPGCISQDLFRSVKGFHHVRMLLEIHGTFLKKKEMLCLLPHHRWFLVSFPYQQPLHILNYSFVEFFEMTDGNHGNQRFGGRWRCQQLTIYHVFSCWAAAHPVPSSGLSGTGIMLYVGGNTMHCNFWCGHFAMLLPWHSAVSCTRYMSRIVPEQL